MTTPNTSDHEQLQISINTHLSKTGFLLYNSVTIAIFLPPKFTLHNQLLVWTQIEEI